jgi:AraC-like DNA-binding protein
MHPYTNRTGVEGTGYGNVEAFSAEVEIRIAIVVFAGFSIKEVVALADIFNAPNAGHTVQQRSPVPGLIFKISLLSMGGDYVADSLSIRIWTEPIEPLLTEKFDGVFVVGAKCRAGAPDDPDILRVVSTLVARADVVVWDSDSALYRLVMAPASAAQRARRSGDRVRSTPLMKQAAVSFVVALASASAQARKRIESQILAHLMPSRNAAKPAAMTSLSAHRNDAPTVSTAATRWTTPIMEGANWLRENYMHPISITHAAEVAKMSERTFLRRFRMETSMTPSEYLLEIRLGVVCSLLKRTRLPVDTIARRCGMRSGERLAKIFRRRLALTPSEFREANR